MTKKNQIITTIIVGAVETELVRREMVRAGLSPSSLSEVLRFGFELGAERLRKLSPAPDPPLTEAIAELESAGLLNKRSKRLALALALSTDSPDSAEPFLAEASASAETDPSEVFRKIMESKNDTDRAS